MGLTQEQQDATEKVRCLLYEADEAVAEAMEVFPERARVALDLCQLQIGYADAFLDEAQAKAVKEEEEGNA